jgi:hypothetical protein
MVAVAATPIRGELPTWAVGGYGYGDGYGYGGDGYGYGYGGDGYGYGYGDDGDGYGYGYGDDGDGYGDDGDGYGYGGDGEYWYATIVYFAAKWNTDQRSRMAELSRSGAKLAFWRSSSSGLPTNGGGKIEVAAPGVVHTSPGPLSLCLAGTLHATLIPPKWKGDRWWVVALIGEVVGDDDKYGCLTREIIGECL